MPAHTLVASALESLSRGPSSAASLVRALGVSQPTLSRTLGELERERLIVRIGATRGTRYALRRQIDAIGSEWPLWRVDEAGNLREVGTLHALAKNHFVVTRRLEQIRLERIHNVCEGMPYFLHDARPAGFVGAAIAAAQEEVGLPVLLPDWSEAHFLTYLTRYSPDSIGDLIVGEESADRFIDAAYSSLPVAEAERTLRYPELAQAAMLGALPQSVAPGVQPKFLTCLETPTGLKHVLVKFSPPRSSPAGQRWADLLRAEHLAHRVLAEHGLPASDSTLLSCGERAFLEVERFDRIGAQGRRGAVTLRAIDAARGARFDSWTACAQRLAAEGLLSGQDAVRLQLLDQFGALIANTDRHFGNVTLFDRYEGPLEVAPVYDMLPMLFAPQNEQVIARHYEPVRPTAATLSVWRQARALAEKYWARLTHEQHLSDEFRELAAQCLVALRADTRVA
jgi:DNA-binding transcriptional ArsR family regulator